MGLDVMDNDVISTFSAFGPSFSLSLPFLCLDTVRWLRRDEE
jgi:hypothetical protein